jgi:hypothetical protein
MGAFEPLARSLGYDRIQLHVFGHLDVRLEPTDA